MIKEASSGAPINVGGFGCIGEVPHSKFIVGGWLALAPVLPVLPDQSAATNKEEIVKISLGSWPVISKSCQS